MKKVFVRCANMNDLKGNCTKLEGYSYFDSIIKDIYCRLKKSLQGKKISVDYSKAIDKKTGYIQWTFVAFREGRFAMSDFPLYFLIADHDLYASQNSYNDAIKRYSDYIRKEIINGLENERRT